MVKVAIVGALRDLRGITVSTYNKRTYNLLFEALYPQFFPLFNRIAEAWYDDTVVMTALLKFLQVFYQRCISDHNPLMIQLSFIFILVILGICFE